MFTVENIGNYRVLLCTLSNTVDLPVVIHKRTPSVIRFIFWVNSFVTGTLSESRLYCDNKSMVASSHEVPAEWKITPNSTQASDYDVLAKIWATRDLLPVTACPAVLHVKGHQDKKTAYEQLPLPAQLNVDADKLAGDYMSNHPNTDYTVVPVLPTRGVHMHLPAGSPSSS